MAFRQSGAMPMTPTIDPTRRRTRVLTVALTVLALLGATVLLLETRGPSLAELVTRGPSIGEIPDAGPWSVGISHRGGPQRDMSSCVRDRSVSSSLMTADLPSSSTSIQLDDAATRDDVQRVLDCLDDALSGGDITVATRR